MWHNHIVQLTPTGIQWHLEIMRVVCGISRPLRQQLCLGVSAARLQCSTYTPWLYYLSTPSVYTDSDQRKSLWLPLWLNNDCARARACTYARAALEHGLRRLPRPVSDTGRRLLASWWGWQPGSSRHRGEQDEVSGALDWSVGSSEYRLLRPEDVETLRSREGCGQCSGLDGLKRRKLGWIMGNGENWVFSTKISSGHAQSEERSGRESDIFPGRMQRSRGSLTTRMHHSSDWPDLQPAASVRQTVVCMDNLQSVRTWRTHERPSPQQTSAGLDSAEMSGSSYQLSCVSYCVCSHVRVCVCLCVFCAAETWERRYSPDEVTVYPGISEWPGARKTNGTSGRECQ